jgi:hypothetical protein
MLYDESIARSWAVIHGLDTSILFVQGAVHRSSVLRRSNAKEVPTRRCNECGLVGVMSGHVASNQRTPATTVLAKLTRNWRGGAAHSARAGAALCKLNGAGRVFFIATEKDGWKGNKKPGWLPYRWANRARAGLSPKSTLSSVGTVNAVSR